MARFLIDVDGVVGDLIELMINDINKRFRPEYPTKLLTHGDITDFYFMNPELGILSPGECKFVIRNFARPGIAYEIPPITGSKEGIKKILAAGHEVVFVTSDWQESPTWVNDRRKWIDEHFGDFEVIFCHKKHYVKGDVLIDDRDKTCESFIKEQPDSLVLMYEQPWNRKHEPSKGIVRFDWRDINKVLQMERFQ